MFKNYRQRLLFIIPFFITQLLVFIWSYSGRPVEIQPLAVIHIILAVAIWIKSDLLIHTKILVIFGTFALNIVTSFLLLLATFNLPGSKEHNNIMFNICFPAMMEHYKVDQLYKIPGDELDKEGNRKWWYQHLECEENVRKGKGAVWSENPPNFIPVNN